MIYIVVLASLFLESIFTNIVSTNSLFIPLFLITSTIILYPYFNNKKSSFVIVCTILGLLYDIIFGTVMTINMISFCVCSILIIKFYENVNYNIYTSNILTILIIPFYRIFSYMLLCITNVIVFNEDILIKGIYKSLLANIIYCTVCYILIDFISAKFKIERIK